jgi:ABC-2 type transport system ATP-binding protein
MQSLVRVERLGVRYGERWALRDLSFELAAGELVGLLGPNGAGKTSTLSVLATLRRPDAGSASLAGFDVVAERERAKRQLGLVPQSLAVYPTLTALENALFFARAAGLSRDRARRAVDEALAVAGLAERRHDAVASFSGGMRRRLNLVCGLLHAPRVLLLDEPSVGVDPQSRERIFDAVRAYAKQGAAVLFSTHYLEEAEGLCDRVLLIDAGGLVAEGTPTELIRRARGGLRLEIATRAPLPAGWERGLDGVERSDAPPAPGGRGHRAQLRIDEPAHAARVLERIAALGHDVLEFQLHQPGLQDVFLELTGRELRD